MLAPDTRYRCPTDSRLDFITIFSLTDLIITENNPTPGQKLYYNYIEKAYSEFGESWEEIRGYFVNHCIECETCQKIYKGIYEDHSKIRDALAQAILLDDAKKNLGLI
ncbi:MAG: hypothetical protein QT11_C0001G0186 [archaeon GW2011_AR20]|nr:MAG: hypothetical protein QT11_C0001G0186 [archaeon GW2011_AR20]MBS3160649.1 hypothetical protein [Candidatus Woesearchaeota archaeon]